MPQLQQRVQPPLVAWVVGATGTIGRAIAEALVRSEVRVIASARNAEKLSVLQRNLESASLALTATAPVDLTSRAAVDAAADFIVSREGRIDILVNCAAAGVFGDFLELDDDDWNSVLQTKLMGYLRTMRAVIPHMVRQKAGAIVNISGRGGRQPTPAHLPGCCANISVNLLTKGLADIYGKDGVRINAVAPGPIASPRHSAIDEQNLSVSSGKTKGRLPPLQRLGAPEEIADAVLFLVSNRASFVTGTTIAVDGGSTATI